MYNMNTTLYIVNLEIVCVCTVSNGVTEVTYLKLVQMDLSENRIATLPVEMRTMSSLVTLELAHNPLVSPPASVSNTTCKSYSDSACL